MLGAADELPKFYLKILACFLCRLAFKDLFEVLLVGAGSHLPQTACSKLILLDELWTLAILRDLTLYTRQVFSRAERLH